MVGVSRKFVAAVSRFHNDEGGDSGVQMVMVLALAAICMFGIGKIIGVGSGEDDQSGIFGVVKKKITRLLGGILG